MKEIILSIFVLTLFFSCTSDSINDSTYDIETFDAIVEGEAMKADGSPLEHTYILIKSYNSTCGEKGEGVSHGTVTPSAGGEFSKQMKKPVEEKINCLEFLIRSKEGVNDTSVTVSSDLEFKTFKPLDKQVVNITF